MKCMASRIEGAGASGDVADIRYLLRHLGVRAVSDALDIVAQFYPVDRIPPRTQFLLEELLGDDADESEK